MTRTFRRTTSDAAARAEPPGRPGPERAVAARFGATDGPAPAPEPGRLRHAALALLHEAVQVARWQLSRIGISIDPYYWSLEGGGDYALRPLAEAGRYAFGLCDIDDPATEAAFPPERLQHLMQCRAGGWQLFCARAGGRIVAFMSLRFDEAPCLGHSLPLGAGEGYIIWVYTTPEARGRGIAAHLRHACYAEMRRRGIDRLYSYIDAMNEAGLGTARKVGIRPLQLKLHVGLGRLHWHIRLRSYSR